jgi:hypothetical protein
MFFLLTRPVALLIKTLFLLAKAKKTSKAYFLAKKAFLLCKKAFLLCKVKKKFCLTKT